MSGEGRGSIVQRFDSLLQAVHEVPLRDLSTLELGEHLKFLRSRCDRLQLEIARVVSDFDCRAAFEDFGEHSTVEWMRRHTHASGASADSQVTLARQLESLETTVSPVEDGSISFEHALLLAREVKDLPESVLESAQSELLAVDDPRDVRRLGNEIRHRDDPEGLNRTAFEQHRKRRLRLFEHSDGMLGIEGALPAPEGMKLRLCLESLVGIPQKGDSRSQEQRRADALTDLCTQAIGSAGLPRLGGRSPQLTVIVRDGGAELEGVGPIGPGTLARLRGEDHHERRQRVDSKGVTLNFGRARRCHSPNQRLEIATRHPRCVVPGCTVPIRDCEIHHSETWWASGGGPTWRMAFRSVGAGIIPSSPRAVIGWNATWPGGSCWSGGSDRNMSAGG